MRKQAAVVILFLLVFAAVGSSALANQSSARSQQSATIREEKRLGPKPLPRWYWHWVNWRLGEGYAKGHGLQAHFRPRSAPRHIERWTWRRLHLFVLARDLRGGGGPVRGGSKTYDQAIGYTHTRPNFAPRRTIKVNNAAELQAAISNLQPGDLVKAATKFTVNGKTVIRNRLAAPAELDLSGVHFVYSGGQNNPAVYLNNARNLYILGGDMSTADTGGQGILDAGSQHVLWWGFTIHDTGSTGFAARAIGGPVDHDDFQGTLWKIGQHLAWDTHCVNECGTGLHGANLWDGATAGNFTNNRFAFYAHDIPTGACVEFGNDDPTSQATGNVLYLKCVDETEVAVRQTGGNGLQLWGDTDTLGLDVKYLEVDHAEGRALEAHGLARGQSLAGVTVEYGRATKTNLSTRFAGESPWDSYGGVVYKRVRPARR